MKKKNVLTTVLLANKAALILLLLCIALSIASPVFLTTTNLVNVVRQVTTSAILSLGFTMVLGAGYMDLSVGSLVGMIGVVMAKSMNAGIPTVPAILIGILFGMAVGVFNVFVITTFKMPPFIVTLASQQVLRGAIYLVTGMIPVLELPESFTFLGQGRIAGIPVPIYIMTLVFVVVWLIINRFKFGRHILAVGGNAEAAFVSGIKTKRIVFLVYMCMGICAAIASVVMTARAASAQPAAGLNMEMDAIAAVVVGGTAMSGGVVNVVGALFGSLIVGVINNAMNLLRLDSNWQLVVKGILIMFALMLDNVSAMAMAKAQKDNTMKKIKENNEKKNAEECV